MHSFKYILVTLIVMLLSCSAQDGYKIKGESPRSNYNTDNSTVYLFEIENDNTLTKIDSTQMYSISKFTIVKNSDYPITPKTGLILVDNKNEQDYNIIYLEQGYIQVTISKTSFMVYNTYLNDKKNDLDKIYADKNSKIQELISLYLQNEQTIDKTIADSNYNEIKALQNNLFKQILDSINTNKDNLLSKGNTLINYYMIKNIKENGNNLFGVELFLDQEQKFKGYELDFALAALSDSIKKENQRFLEYINKDIIF